MSDVETRRLEVAAAAGDLEALARLERNRARDGSAPEPPPEPGHVVDAPYCSACGVFADFAVLVQKVGFDEVYQNYLKPKRKIAGSVVEPTLVALSGYPAPVSVDGPFEEALVLFDAGCSDTSVEIELACEKGHRWKTRLRVVALAPKEPEPEPKPEEEATIVVADGAKEGELVEFQEEEIAPVDGAVLPQDLPF